MLYQTRAYWEKFFAEWEFCELVETFYDDMDLPCLMLDNDGWLCVALPIFTGEEARVLRQDRFEMPDGTAGVVEGLWYAWVFRVQEQMTRELLQSAAFKELVYRRDRVEFVRWMDEMDKQS